MHNTHSKREEKKEVRAIAIARTRPSHTLAIGISICTSMFLMGLMPLFAHAATTNTFEISGWLPYWRGATSTMDVLPHLDSLTEVDPFVYTLKSDGTLLDNAPLNQEPWVSFLAAAKAKKVRVVPTVMTSNGALIHQLIGNPQSRATLEDTIANTVKTGGFDGIDIDFEGKQAADKDNFSSFLQGLAQRLNGKWLMCTIESRTPTDSRYYGSEVPPDAEIYANDFTQINKYCDRVRIMTYDQQGIDQQLAATAASSSELYAPVADPAWVTKVINLVAQSISKDKIEIGIPTYGYEYAVTAYAGNQYVYDILWTFNPLYATQVAQQYGVSPSRAAWGEMQLAHIKDGAAATTTSVTAGSYSALAAAAAASQYAQAGNTHIDFRYLVWPDAQSIAQKIALAKSLGVRGVSIFKMDGGEDPGMWQVIANAQAATGVVAAPIDPVPTTPTPGASGFTRTLTLGSTGEDVRLLQKVLNSSSATRVAASGVGSAGNENTKFGPATLAALKKFQVKYGIAKAGKSGYGVVGPATRAKLNSLLPL